MTDGPAPREIAEEIITQLGVVYVPELNEFRMYQDGLFVAAEKELLSKIRDVFDSAYEDQNKNATKRKNEVLDYIRDKSRMYLKDFDTDPWVLNLNNGLLDVRTRARREWTREYPSLRRIPVSYDPKASCPRIEKFLSEIVRPEDVTKLYEIIAYCLVPEYPIQVFIFLLGGGANGKSSWLELVKRFLGKENVSSIAIQDLGDNRFAGSALVGKLANIYPDIPSKGIFDTGRVKGLTGGDNMSWERKYGHIFFGSNSAKLIFSGNRLPKTYDDSDAWYRRYESVDFPNQFAGSTARPQPEILSELEQEFSGLLNRCLEVLPGLLKRNEFTNAKTIEAKRRDYKMNSDTVFAFGDHALDFAAENWIPKQELYNRYKDYCTRNKFTALSDKKFFRDLTENFNVVAGQPEIGGRRTWSLKGIVFVCTGCTACTPFLHPLLHPFSKRNGLLPHGSSRGENREKPVQPVQAMQAVGPSGKPLLTLEQLREKSRAPRTRRPSP